MGIPPTEGSRSMDQSRAGLGLRAAFFAGLGKTGLEDCTEAELQEYRALLNKLDDALSDELRAASRARRRFHTPEQRGALRREAEADAVELPVLLEEAARDEAEEAAAWEAASR